MRLSCLYESTRPPYRIVYWIGDVTDMLTGETDPVNLARWQAAWPITGAEPPREITGLIDDDEFGGETSPIVVYVGLLCDPAGGPYSHHNWVLTGLVFDPTGTGILLDVYDDPFPEERNPKSSEFFPQNRVARMVSRIAQEHKGQRFNTEQLLRLLYQLGDIVRNSELRDQLD